MRAAALVMLCACFTSSPTKPPEVPGPGNLPTRFDGFALGDRFAPVNARAPYEDPCDDDPAEGGKLRHVVYGARGCRNSKFPGDTSVVFVIDGGDTRSASIRAFGWMGPYYDDKVRLPVKRLEPAAKAIEQLGKPIASFDLRVLHIDQFAGITVLSDRGTIVGFAFGELPPDPAGAHWETFDEMYRRYTPRPASPGVTAADCLAVLRHATTLSGGDPDEMVKGLHERGRYDREIDQCRAEGTPELIRCALAATTKEAIELCEPKDDE